MPRSSAVLMLLVGLVSGAFAQQSDPVPDADGYYSLERLEKDVNPPKLVRPSSAPFPSDSRLAGLKYSRIVAASVDANGKLTEAHIVSPNPGPFDAPALDAVKNLEFEPAKLHGRPIPAKIEIWVPFVPGEKRAVPEIMPLKFTGFHKDDRPPTVLMAPEAEFSDEARRAGFQGVVLITVLVTERGELQDIRLVLPLGKGLDEKALEAVRRYKFAPALRWGIPVQRRITIEVNFRL